MTRGRPSDYTPEIAALICQRLADGESLRAICGEDEMPSRETVRRWLNDDEEFRAQYARSREEQADSIADEALAVARGIEPGGPDPRLHVDTLKWRAGRMAPKRWGDRVAHEVTGADGGPIAVDSRAGLAEKIRAVAERVRAAE